MTDTALLLFVVSGIAVFLSAATTIAVNAWFDRRRRLADRDFDARVIRANQRAMRDGVSDFRLRGLV